MTTTSTGRKAEQGVARYLESSGYKIIESNWRTRWCEIDIIAQKGEIVCFIEVKYRKSNAWGSGLEYITPAKLRQMRFAAEFWVSTNNWKGECSLQAVEVSGNDFEVGEFIEFS